MNDLDFLKLAIKQAEKSIKEGGFPAGAIVVKDGKVVSEGVSKGYIDHDPTGHAETAAIRQACQNLKTVDLEGAALYESLECCLMCFSVANWANIKRIVFAARKTEEMVKKFYYEGSTNNKIINEQNNNKIELVFIPDLEEESLKLVKEWEEKQGLGL